MTVGIIGLGYVGLTLAVASAANGVDVYGIEKDVRVKNSLKENKAHFFEPGIDAMIRRVNGKSFHVVEKFPENVKYDVIVITVGTPLMAGTDEPNFEYIKSALQAVSHFYDGSQLVILRSTVSVGTTRNIVMPSLAQMCGKPENDVLVAMCPERTIEGKAIDELSHLPQIISGNNKTSLEIAQRYFRHMTPCVVEASSLEEAELIKLYCNTYRDMTFAIGNAFCMAAQKFGVDGISAIGHANYGYARSNIAKPGYVAGPCLEKDAYILVNNMPDCDSKNFILSARKFNESMEDSVVEWVRKKIGKPSENKIITLSGMTFKGQPETSDLRGSTSVYIAKKLKDVGYKMNLHDFVAHADEMRSLQLGTYYENLYDACANASLLLILNNHKKYGQILPEDLPPLTDDFEILDSWNVCTELHFSNEIKISTLGNMFN